ncbi:hypothetical protein [Acinetobacter vivianii]|uniref:hypothetical protein n=1 Tax=Acinetobacter vivianii TaxID=1776742 RepID=UPI003CFCE732
MTVENTNPIQHFTANGETTVFTINFAVEGKDNIKVTVNGTDVSVNDYSYDTSLNAVVFNTAPIDGVEVVIERVTSLDRSINYQTYNNSFRPETLNYDLDRIWHVLQEDHITDAEILARIKEEIEWRRTHDTEWDLLAQARESNLFNALKSYMDTIGAMSVPNLFDGITDNVVITEDGVSQRALNKNTNQKINELNENLNNLDGIVDNNLIEAKDYTNLEQQRAVGAEALLQLQVNAIGAGNIAYKTYADMVADNVSIPAKSKVTVTNDDDLSKVGDYQYDGITFTKSVYDPITQVKTDLLDKEYGKNLYNPATVQIDKRVIGSGTINTIVGAKCTDFIPVKIGEYYTISCVGTRPAIFEVYKADKVTSVFHDSSNVSTISFQIPTEGAYLVVNIQSETVPEPSNFQIEKGVVATSYEPYTVKSKMKADLLPANVIIAEEVEGLISKSYEIKKESKNLFNEADVQLNRYLSSGGVGINVSSGWSCSGYIPVVAGKTYTLSYATRSRQGIQYFKSRNVTDVVTGTYVGTEGNPYTTTAPPDANYIVFNLQSATAQGWSKIQFEEGGIATEYLPFGENITYLNPEYIYKNGESTVITDKSSLELADTTAKINTTVNGKALTLNLAVRKTDSYTGSKVFNFVSDFYDDIQIRACGDDSAPVRMMGATVGANHGYARSILTVTAHGKTNSDIGSIWDNGSKQWVITQIVNANQISVTSRLDNQPVSSNALTFTHVGGANNTNVFTASSTSGAQWYPMTKNYKLDIFVDNQPVSDIGTYEYAKSIKFIESYDLMEKSDIVEWLILNGGKEVTIYNAASAISLSIVHDFDTEGGCVTTSDFYVVKDLSTAQDVMFTQSARMDTTNGNVLYTIPKSIPFMHEGINYDFSKPTSVNNMAITTRIDFTASKQDSEQTMIDRVIQTNNNISYATGYLPILDADPAIRSTRTSKAFQISNSSSKLYPYLIDSLTALPKGTYYSAVSYRKYFNGGAYFIRHELGDYVIGQWNTAGTYRVEVPSDLVGRKVELVEKTANINIASQITTKALIINVSDSNAANMILKLM